jgi:outer membrane protein assembly factor BamE
LRTTLLILVLLAAMTLGGCGFLQPHRVPVQQGNVVTQQMIDQLEPGMTRRQVAYVLGEPVLRNEFEPNRWDYVYSIYDRDRRLEVRRVSLFFREDRLSHFVGDVAPSGVADARDLPGLEPHVSPELDDDAVFPVPGTDADPDPLPEPGLRDPADPFPGSPVPGGPR